MDRPRHIEDLADELLNEILSFLTGPDVLRHDSLLTSASDLPLEPNGYGERLDLDRLRLVNRRFMRIGTPRKFCRFVLRFSSEGFKRLEEFLDMQLACHVRHFTYMVRPFYQGSGWPQVLSSIDTDERLPVSILRNRLEDQSFLIDTDRDLLLLRRALASFPSLQQIKLLRLQDGADEQFLQCIRDTTTSSEETTTKTEFNWEPACTRAVNNLSLGLLESPCNPIRFVGPHISITPETTALLQAPASSTLSAVGARLSGLGINFHTTNPPSNTPDDAVTHSPSLHTTMAFFESTSQNLACLHLGFPAETPLPLPLEHIIPPTVHWKRLHTLSLQGWCISAVELSALLRRHSRQLRDVRLRNIYLSIRGDNDGGDGGGDGDGQGKNVDTAKWSDILSILRYEMGLLERVELRAIDYVGHHQHHHNNHTHTNTHTHTHTHTPYNNSSSSSSSSSNNPSNDNDNPVEIAERLHALTVDELDDDGVGVRPGQDWEWEAWVRGG